MGTGIEVDGVPVADKGSGHPIGWTYIQFPGMKAPIPAEMPDIIGVWEPVTSLPAGAFIRLPGGDASEFESGLQADQMKDFEAEISYKSGYGLLQSDAILKGAVKKGASRGNSLAGSSTNGNDIIITPSADPSIRSGENGYPENITIILWERKS